MELNSLLFAFISFFATIGSIETQWNSRLDRNSTWRNHRGNRTDFPSNQAPGRPHNPYYGNSTIPHAGNSTFTDDRYGHRTQNTPEPQNWAGGNSDYNGQNYSHQHNSSRLYPELPGSRQGESHRRGEWNNSTKLYPSLSYFRITSGTAQNGTGRPQVYQNQGNSSYPSAQRYPR